MDIKVKLPIGWNFNVSPQVKIPGAIMINGIKGMKICHSQVNYSVYGLGKLDHFLW